MEKILGTQTCSTKPKYHVVIFIKNKYITISEIVYDICAQYVDGINCKFFVLLPKNN